MSFVAFSFACYVPPHLNMCFVCLAAADVDAGEITKDIPDINLGKFMSKFSSSPESSSTFSLVTNDRLHGNGTKLLQGGSD